MMRKYLLIPLLILVGQSLKGQTKFELIKINETEIDCKYKQNYFELTGKEYVLSVSELNRLFGSPEEMVEYTFKGKINGTNISVIEELHLHESYQVLIDSTSNRKYRIRGNIYFSNDRQFFAAFNMGSTESDPSLSIWKVNSWNIEKIYENNTPKFWLEKFCWNDRNEFNMKFRIDSEINIVRLRFNK